MGNYEIDMDLPTPEEEKEFAERFKAHREAVKAVVANLEAKYADRQLKFSVPFSGSIPVQAFGYIDGYRFYFRFRHDCASLRAGIASPEYYVRINTNRKERELSRLAKLEDDLATGKITRAEYDEELDFFSLFKKDEDEKAPEFDDTHFYPTHIKEQSEVDNYTGEPYEGSLTAPQMNDVFTRLVDNLVECDYKF